MNKLVPYIGIEVHVELLTNSKIFSPSCVSYGDIPNSNVSIIDLGYPGSLPTLNKKVVEQALKVASALNCTINRKIVFERKNYFYPDNSKNYQIMQNKFPLGYDGYLTIGSLQKKIRIDRLHMEEDAAKSIHKEDYTLLDFNRCGNPLIEIVTKPDFNSSTEVKQYIEKLRDLLIYLGVSDGKMEEGSIRCDVNISMYDSVKNQYGTKTEIKNLNSTKNMVKAIEFEIQRQSNLLLLNQEVLMETRRYDEVLKETTPLRTKETKGMYRFFEEPDLPPYIISTDMIDQIQNNLPELREQRIERYRNLSISEIDAYTITKYKDLSDLFDEVLNTEHIQQILKWLLNDIISYLNKNKLTLNKTYLNSNKLVELANLNYPSNRSRRILPYLMSTNKSINEIVAEYNLMDENRNDEVVSYIQELIIQHSEIVEMIQKGNMRKIQYFVGEVLKHFQGKVSPIQAKNEILNALNLHEKE